MRMGMVNCAQCGRKRTAVGTKCIVCLHRFERGHPPRRDGLVLPPGAASFLAMAALSVAMLVISAVIRVGMRYAW